MRSIFFDAVQSFSKGRLSERSKKCLMETLDKAEVNIPSFIHLETKEDKIEIEKIFLYSTFHLVCYPERLAANKVYELGDFLSFGRRSLFILGLLTEAHEYDRIVDVGAEAFDSLFNPSERELIITYDCFLKTKNKIFYKKLLRRGWNFDKKEES